MLQFAFLRRNGMTAKAGKAHKGGKKDKKANEAKASKPEKLARKVYEDALLELQVELCALQEWVKENGKRIIIILEGRDTAGKSGLIRVIKERVSSRGVPRRRTRLADRRTGGPSCSCSATSSSSRSPGKS
jgi:polyphosphate kinase 2 (PPK2 family)